MLFSDFRARGPISIPNSAGCAPFYPREERWMRFEQVVWVWVMVIFRWLCFLFSSIEATLIDDQQLFPDRTIWSWPLNRKIRMPRTCQNLGVEPSTKLLPIAFRKKSFPLLPVLSFNLYKSTITFFIFHQSPCLWLIASLEAFCFYVNLGFQILIYFKSSWLVGWLVVFYGISTFVGHSTPNSVYVYIRIQPKISKRILR